jgi:hypothetical protein
VVAVAGLLAPGCQVIAPTAALRVLSINGGSTLRSDLSDFLQSFNKEDSVWELFYQVPPDEFEVELQYVEIGAGLPTVTPYEAIISKVVISKFKSSLPPDDAPPYINSTITLNEHVPSDPEGKKTTTFNITPFPTWWKEKVFGADGAGLINEDDPTVVEVVDLVTATATFSGYDPTADHDVEASGEFQVEFGNLYDDPSRYGRP